MNPQRERTQIELVVTALTVAELGLGGRLVAGTLDGAVVLGPETLTQSFRPTAASTRPRRDCHNNDHDNREHDPNPGRHPSSSEKSTISRTIPIPEGDETRDFDAATKACRTSEPPTPTARPSTIRLRA
jgi:hypothetical protein